jgi:hypothetical protein
VDLGDSTQVRFSFREHRIWAEACVRGKPSVPDSLDAEFNGYHDEVTDTVAKPAKGEPENAKGASLKR